MRIARPAQALQQLLIGQGGSGPTKERHPHAALNLPGNALGAHHDLQWQAVPENRRSRRAEDLPHNLYQDPPRGAQWKPIGSVG